MNTKQLKKALGIKDKLSDKTQKKIDNLKKLAEKFKSLKIKD